MHTVIHINKIWYRVWKVLTLVIYALSIRPLSFLSQAQLVAASAMRAGPHVTSMDPVKKHCSFQMVDGGMDAIEGHKVMAHGL